MDWSQKDSRTPSEIFADFSYSYGDALADGVVRPVVFAAYTGTSRWLNDAGEAFADPDANTGSISQLN